MAGTGKGRARLKTCWLARSSPVWGGLAGLRVSWAAVSGVGFADVAGMRPFQSFVLAWPMVFTLSGGPDAEIVTGVHLFDIIEV